MAKKSEIEKFEDGDFEFAIKEIGKMENVQIMDATDLPDPDPNNSGSYSLDFDLGIPFPGGRLIEVYGDEGCGKTTLSLEVMGNALQRGQKALYVNMERNLNRSLLMSIRTIRPYMEAALSEDKKTRDSCPLQIVKCSCGEDAFNVIRRFAEMVPGSVIVLDSVDACIPREVLAADIGDAFMGKMGKMMSEACRGLIAAVEANNVSFIFINQFREKVGVNFGDPRTTPGGRALRFYSSQRVLLLSPSKACLIKDDDNELVGHMMRYEVIKNKCRAQGPKGEIPLIYGQGIYREQELVDMCLKFGILGLGGRGGKQVLLPVRPSDADEDEYEVNEDGFKVVDGEVVTQGWKKSEAVKRLGMDPVVKTHLDGKLREFIAV